MRLSVAVAVACLSAMGLSTAAEVEAAAKRDTTIPAQGLGPALRQLATDRDVQLVYRSELVGDKRTNGAVGQLTFNEALTKLLDGTGLTFQYIEDRAITLVPVAGSASALGEVAYGTESSASGRLSVWQRLRLAQADTASMAATASEGSEPSPQRSSSLEEVVVTAQRRGEERLIDVPISMSVLSGEALDTSTVTNMTEALSRVPGVTVSESIQGGGSQVPVRGVAAGGPLFVGSSPTAYYLDSAPFGFVKTAIGPDPDTYDLKQVEVLRGPQGTLYGASALNGVVRVLTQDPDLDTFEFKARASASSTEDGSENYRGDLAANVPMVEGKFAARAVIGYQELGGFVDKPNHDNANDAERRTMRLKLKAQPTDDLSLGLSAWSSRADYGAPNAGLDNYQRPSVLDEPIDTNYDVYALDVGYDFPGFSISSTTSYLDYLNRSFLDLGALGATGFRLETKMEATTFAQEVRLNSTHEGAWQWSVGGIYRDGEDRLFQFSPEGLYVTPLIWTQTSKSYAVFGEVTRSFLDGLFELTGGVRYFEDDVGQVEGSRALVAGQPPAQLINSDSTFEATSPRVALTWHPSESTTLYASYSEGFRSGSNQNPQALAVAPLPPAEPDTLANYEVGAKASLLGGRLDLDTALYYIDWQDVQQSLLVPTGEGAGVTTAIVNGESASGIGLDVAVTAELVRGLLLGLNFSWNDLTVDSDVPLPGGVPLFKKGDRLNWSSEYTAGASAEYGFPLGKNGFEGRFSVSGNYASAMESRGTLASGAPVVALSDSILIARTSFTINAPERWSATLFIDNVNDERGSPTRTHLSDEWAVRLRPRTVGVQFEYRY